MRTQRCSTKRWATQQWGDTGTVEGERVHVRTRTRARIERRSHTERESACFERVELRAGETPCLPRICCVRAWCVRACAQACAWACVYTERCAPCVCARLSVRVRATCGLVWVARIYRCIGGTPPPPLRRAPPHLAVPHPPPPSSSLPQHPSSAPSIDDTASLITIKG